MSDKVFAVMVVIAIIGLFVSIIGWEIGSTGREWGVGFLVLTLGALMTGVGAAIAVHITRLDVAAEEFEAAKINIERKLKKGESSSAIDEAKNLNQQLEELLKADFMHCTRVMNCTPIELDAYPDIEEIGEKEEETEPPKTIRYQCPDCEKQFYIEKRMQEELPSGFLVCPYCDGNQVELENIDD